MFFKCDEYVLNSNSRLLYPDMIMSCLKMPMGYPGWQAPAIRFASLPEEDHRFQCDRLSSRIRSADDQYPVFGIQLDIHGHSRLPGRMVIQIQ